ncbi:SDR family oxidoreductase [Thermodesulfobacteriota bacterium]
METLLKPVLVAGGTGYVGGRLVPELINAGYRVRVMGRSLAKLKGRSWANDPSVELSQADVLDRDSLNRAAKGCGAAFYLVHSMNSQSKDFAESDRVAARNMVSAAASSKLERIIYLGGLGSDDPSLSKHLKSRVEVANILQSGPVPATFLRAGIILGSGSASFEILRYLVDRLPIMITPRWVHTPCQPIAIRNIIHYLMGCLEHDETMGGTFDIGGPEILTYQRVMEIYAEEAGLPHRWIVPVPVLTPKLSSYWIHLITPVPSSIARPLTEGLRNPAVCREDRIRSIIPQELIDCRKAIQRALEISQQQCIDTCWSDAGTCTMPEWAQCGDADYAGGTILECGYRVVLEAQPEDTWKPIERIGGRTGWYFGSFLWSLRGLMDRLVGGVGLRRGRRHPEDIFPGDALDFWRVLEVDKPNRLQLLAEMKLPGEAILEFRNYPLNDRLTELQLDSRFLPRGLLGILYWYALYPVHKWIFTGMIKEIAKAVGKPIRKGPERFAPGRHHVCHFDPRDFGSKK